MRLPPEGTVARERLAELAIDVAPLPDGGYVADNPVPVTPALLEEGRHQFDIVCATCHGLLGNGQSMAAQNMSLRPPPDLHAYRNRPDGYFFEIITDGFGLMPAYGRELTPHQRWAIVSYVRALQLSQHASLDMAPEAERQKLEVSP
jgi:mono/diheme cytochrome c family protein